MNTNLLRRIVVHGMVVAVGVAATGAAARGAVVGDPARPAELPGLVAAAYQRGERDITIAPGTYALPAGANGGITLEHWKDAVLRAPGVVLIFAETGRRPLRFDGCANVLFQGATLRLAAAPDTQGRITALGVDAQGKYCDWQIDTGYSTDFKPQKSCFDVVDQQTRRLKVQTGDMGPSAIDPLGAGLYRMHFAHGLAHVAAGDWLVTRAAGGSVICHVDNSTNVTLKDLTLQNGGFATLFETGGGGNHFLHCTITYGPKPAGATEEEVLSCGADGFHSVGTTQGPDIEDCDFQGVYHDDCIAIHGTFQEVISATGNQVVLKRGGHYAPQDPIRFSDDQGFFAQAACAAVQELGGPDHHVQITLDQPLAVPAKAKADNPNHCGRGFKILRCHLGNTRSRGILVKADDGIIDGCTIEGCGMSAISIGPEYYWNEADYSWNVTVSNNTIRACVKNDGNQGALWVHGDGAIGNRHIVIKNNTFDGNYGQYLLRLEWADGLEITGNQILHPCPLPRKDPGELLHLAHAHNVQLRDNVVQDLAPGAAVLVGVHADVEGLVNPDATGIGPRK